MAEIARPLKSIKFGDVEIATRIEGSGPALVMLPSYGRDGLSDFDQVARRIAAAGWNVVRPQPRGIAGSSGPMAGLTLKNLAADVAGVINDLRVGPAVILGHAFGNFIARVMAVEYPSVVRGVILASPASSPNYVSAQIQETPFIAGDPRRSEDERLTTLRLAFFAPHHDARPWLQGWYPETLAMQHAAAKATDLKRYVDVGAAPVLEIIPGSDTFQPKASWSELRDQIGDRVQTVVIEDSGHALFPEQPSRVAEEVIGGSPGWSQHRPLSLRVEEHSSGEETGSPSGRLCCSHELKRRRSFLAPTLSYDVPLPITASATWRHGRSGSTGVAPPSSSTHQIPSSPWRISCHPISQTSTVSALPVSRSMARMRVEVTTKALDRYGASSRPVARVHAGVPKVALPEARESPLLAHRIRGESGNHFKS